ncbi:PKD domain-containing protein [Flavobacterium flavipallidum]|uniref:PKD domain-containing protein n=1 Tax=Flavobacterium flavipallidum TaxID=3139140 RepID=A0ABU9HKB2_9FLAO
MILKKLTKCKMHYFFALLFASVTLLSCEGETKDELVLFEPGTINPTASKTAILNHQTIDFSSNATKVQSLSWKFPGGTPSTSSSEDVTVQYNSGGTFVATLEVKHIDNTIEIQTFSITVSAPPIPPMPTITGLGIYTERTTTESNPGLAPTNNGNCEVTEVDINTHHGNKTLFYHYVPTSLTSGFGLSHMDLSTKPFNVSAYSYLNISLKSSTSRNVRVRLNTNSGNYWVVLKPSAPLYGMLWDGVWHELKIPFSALLKDGIGAALSATPAALQSVNQFTMRTDDGDYSTTANSWDFYVDDIYLTTN